MSNDTQIILVEPGAGVNHGHFVEKLTLWIDGMAAQGLRPTVVCWDLPCSRISGADFTNVTSVLARRLFKLLPERRLAMWAEVWTYLKAFRLARQRGWPVIGLTTSTPLPVAVAARLARPPAKWGQIVMYGGLHHSPSGLEIRSRELNAFQSLLRNGCQLLCNAPLTAEMLEQRAAGAGGAGRVFHLPDPIYLSPAFGESSVGKYDWPASVLVPGQDDHRRTPLAHLARAELAPPIADLSVLQPGKATLTLAGGTEWVMPGFVRRVRVLSEYQTGDALAGVFGGAKFSFLVYSPDFLQGSAHLALSVACGTPVLCSRFPYAEGLFRQFGRIGEPFTYGDPVDFQRAWARLAGWSMAEWEEFEAARRRLQAEVSHRKVARCAAKWMGVSPPTDAGQP